MSRKFVDPTARLKRLLAVREAVEDPESVVNGNDMARILGMTWKNLRDTIAADIDFPIHARGAEGIAWEFRVVVVLDHLIAGCRAVIEQAHSKEQRVAKLAGVAIGGGSTGSAISINDYRAIDQMQREQQRRKIEQREWMRRDDVRALMSNFFAMVQSEHTSMAAELDPAGKWAPDVRADVEDHMRTILVRLHDSFGAYINDDARRVGRPRTRVRAARGGSALRKRA